MKYSVSPEALSSVFMLPTGVADKYLKLATSLQLKVLLFVFRNLSEGIDVKKTAEFLKESEDTVGDALEFWVQSGILTGENEQKNEKPVEAVPAKITLPSREDVIRRGMEDKNVTLIMREAQNYFGGGISGNVSSFLLSLYDDCGMDTSVILFLLSYAAKKEKCNLVFLRNTANSWLKAGVETVADAENELVKFAKQDLAWSVVQKAFGIERRKPSENEKTLSDMWINEWNVSEDLLKAAYDTCVDAKSKFIFGYVAKVIEAWHKDGITSAEQLKGDSKPKTDKKGGSKYSYGGFDIDKFNEMLNNDD